VVPINQATDVLWRYFYSLKVVPEHALKVSCEEPNIHTEKQYNTHVHKVGLPQAKFDLNVFMLFSCIDYIIYITHYIAEVLVIRDSCKDCIIL
jgi:hypothetical protein